MFSPKFRSILAISCIVALLAVCQMNLTPASANERQALVHVIHLINGGPRVDVYVDDVRIVKSLKTASFTHFLAVEAGAHQLYFTPTGEGTNNAVTAPSELALEAGHRYTLALIGQQADNSIHPLIIDETAAVAGVDLSHNFFRIIINNIAGSPPISFYEGERWLEKNLEYGQYSAQAFTPFSYTKGRAVVGENLSDVIFNFDAIGLETGGYWEPYSVYVYGLMGKYPGTENVDYIFAKSAAYVLAPDVVAFANAMNSYEMTDGVNNFQFTTFASAAEQIELAQLLGEEGPFTIFLPTDAAFNALPKDQRASLFADKDQLRTLLLNHVLKGALTTYDDLRKAKTITTLGGATISYTGTETHGITFLINDTLEVNGFGYEFPDGSVVYLLRNKLIAP